MTDTSTPDSPRTQISRLMQTAQKVFETITTQNSVFESSKGSLIPSGCVATQSEVAHYYYRIVDRHHLFFESHPMPGRFVLNSTLYGNISMWARYIESLISARDTLADIANPQHEIELRRKVATEWDSIRETLEAIFDLLADLRRVEIRESARVVSILGVLLTQMGKYISYGDVERMSEFAKRIESLSLLNSNFKELHKELKLLTL